MAFHHERAWYNIYCPNPDGAICRLRMGEAEWQRMTKWRDLQWFKAGGLEAGRILLGNRHSVSPILNATSATPHLLPAAGMPSASHALRHPWFYHELCLCMQRERDGLVRQGLLRPDQHGRSIPCGQSASRGGKPIMTVAQRKERDTQVCWESLQQMEREGWFNSH